ncbi:MAG: amidophosphoribosyltransferase [Prevotella sp.]|nr:amidophosphoribosyltransferase [Prevotella sp.]
MGGFFGTIAKHNCSTDLFYGTDYNSHLGTKRGGMATYDAEKNAFSRVIHNLENTYFRTKFECELGKFTGNSGIGIISDTDPQPIILNSHLGRFAIVTVAKITNTEEIVQELLEKNMHFGEQSSGTNQTELVALLIIQGKNFVEGIENVFSHIKGSCSMLLLTEDGIICARDQWGRTPIIIGKKEGAYAITSETSSFPNLDYEIERYIGPGEIVRVKADGIEQMRKPNEEMQICSFLWVYYGFPTSYYEGMNVEDVRNKSGYMMGKEDTETDVDCACGIPDSGVGMALGYAEGKGVPYHRAISKYTPTWPRSFTPGTQEMRNLVAKMKLIPNKEMLAGKKVLFCDDSIVRGTQLRDNVKMLYDCGAKEVHIRIACPPLIYGCPFIGFTSSKSDLELITRRIIKELEGDENANLEKYAQTDSPEYKKLVEIMRSRFGFESLKFSKLENLVEAIGLPKCKLCTHCFDGSSHF